MKEQEADLQFKNLTILIEKYLFPPSQIYNVDESDITTISNHIPKYPIKEIQQ